MREILKVVEEELVFHFQKTEALGVGKRSELRGRTQALKCKRQVGKEGRTRKLGRQ